MFILDDLLLLPLRLPVAGINWIMKQIQTMANEELLNDQPWKERLIELQMKLELGEVSEAEFAEEEKLIFQRLREIRQAREEWAASLRAEDEDEGTGIDVHTGYGE